MWDIVVNALRALNLQGLSNFLNFVTNREIIVKSFTKDQLRLVGAATMVIEKVQNKGHSKEFCSMAQFASEYLQTLIDNTDRFEIEKMLIDLGKVLEIKHTQMNDPLLQSLSVRMGGELARIERL